MVLTGFTPKASAEKKNSSRLVERTYFDWSRSGEASVFSLFRQENASGIATDRLVISVDGKKISTLRSYDGGWATMSQAGLSTLNKQNLVPNSKHFLFVSSNVANAPIYLILKGADSGCCVGSLTVVTLDEHRQPRIVFQASSHLLAAVTPISDESALELIGQPSDSEARALKNAQSYDPYRVYVLDHDRPARYDLALSKAYTLKHYCQWHGPKYDEKFVAVGQTIGSRKCHVMTESDFASYRDKHPLLLPEQ